MIQVAFLSGGVLRHDGFAFSQFDFLSFDVSLCSSHDPFLPPSISCTLYPVCPLLPGMSLLGAACQYNPHPRTVRDYAGCSTTQCSQLRIMG